ncbi:hypothetical protein F2Q69_00012967 [Brassica cretica]|uniref:Uncharacterized protein n=1 Tax=Brassica cretica TaxID=69181 RepID=A0A8S9R9R0_BRACR|nr:hypothetical protein F2Q69_00012967 [Brassica cretica]
MVRRSRRGLSIGHPIRPRGLVRRVGYGKLCYSPTGSLPGAGPSIHGHREHLLSQREGKEG